MLLRCTFAVIFIVCVITKNVDSVDIVEAPKEDSSNWWKNAVIYQLYTRSFRDNNNDGVGDFNGIIEKLNYISTSGYTAIWLPPIFEALDSPDAQVDFGYEITNYQAINPLYGTLKEFQDLVSQAHKLGIKIILELVPNHSSFKHEWFTNSEKQTAGYEDYYVWYPGRDPDPSITPPNDWKNHYGKSAWEYSPTRKEWYLHQFSIEQPDLSYRSKGVQDEMKKVINFWLTQDVDGFILADAPFLVENEKCDDDDNTAADESLNNGCTSNQDETFVIIDKLRGIIDQHNKDKQKEVILVTKAHTDLQNAIKYCGQGDKKGAHFTYNFQFTEKLTASSNARDISSLIKEWNIFNIPEKCVSNWVLGNHDLHRLATRFGTQKVDGLNALLAFLPGIMITYNGEEIGQENGKVKWTECKDPLACKGAEENYEANSRDFERTPFHWDTTTNAGFNKKTKPWLPVATDQYTSNNLYAQNRPAVTSHYNAYKALVQLRKEVDFNTNTVEHKALSDNVLAVIRKTGEGKGYIAIINFSDTEEKIDLSQIAEYLVVEKYVKVVIASSESEKHDRLLSANDITLSPYESIIVKPVPTKDEGNLDWWKHAVVYQIYPLSFKDSNNDGVGDIRGIISKLDHLKDIGITAAWLSPIYKSPQVDQGYDISDFKDIYEKFGTLQDFDDLIKKANELEIKIILDFVPNHSSDQHPWFQLSIDKVDGYEDFYVWKSGRTVPNNWKSIFKGSAWTKNSKRNQYYLHQFAPEQPDLNYENPFVMQQMKEVMEFWLDRGVYGFRMDAVPHLREDQEFKNEPKIEGSTTNDWESLEHVYTKDQPKTFEMIYKWREFVDDYTKEHGGDARILMTEAYTDTETTMKYYGNGVVDGAHFSFNFLFITGITKNSNANDIESSIKEWIRYMPSEYVANWVLGNHDNHRIASRMGVQNVDGFNMLIAMLPGVMVTYNGEEIGQEDGEVNYMQRKDPSTKDVDRKEFYQKSRDFERTPFHWDTTTNAGFNRGAETWLPVSRKYYRANLELEKMPEKTSHYHIYKKLLELRKDQTLNTGTLTTKAISENVLSVVRSLGDKTYVLIFNVGEEVEKVNVDEILKDVTPYLKVEIQSFESYRNVGDLIPSKNLLLTPHEGIIATTTKDRPRSIKPAGYKETRYGQGTTVDGVATVTVSFTAIVIAVMCSVFWR